MPAVEIRNIYPLPNGTYQARLQVPQELRAALGRSVFKFNTGEKDLVKASRKAAPVLDGWKAAIEKARDEGATPLAAMVAQARARFRSLAQNEPETGRDPWEVVEDLLDRLGVSGRLTAEQERGLVEVITADTTPLVEHKDAWVASLANMQPRQRDQYAADLERFLAFAGPDMTVEGITGRDAQRYVDEATAQGFAPKTIKRQLSALSNYWEFLRSREVVKEERISPFARRRVPEVSRTVASKNKRLPFTAAEVMALHRAAIKAGDTDLADLILIGAYTGARIEEIASLTVAALDLPGRVVHLNSKTEAGDRKVPVHDTILGTLEARAKAAQAGQWLFHVSGENRYSERSMAIGKRFGRLKTAAGFGPQHVFHSIRKTVATLFEDAHCPEGVAADILGHDKPTMTYGLYSGGSSMATRREWLEKALAPYADAAKPEDAAGD